MEKDEKITLWSERIHEFQFSGQTCKNLGLLYRQMKEEFLKSS